MSVAHQHVINIFIPDIVGVVVCDNEQVRQVLGKLFNDLMMEPHTCPKTTTSPWVLDSAQLNLLNASNQNLHHGYVLFCGLGAGCGCRL